MLQFLFFDRNESLRFTHWEPLDLLLFKKVQNVRLSTIQVTWINALDMDDEIDVLPLVVILLPMNAKACFSFSIECLLVDCTNETVVPHVSVGFTLVVSQLRKSIDDDTENNVEQDCDDQ